MRQQPLFLHPWQAAELMQQMALKANDPNALPDYVAHLASGTADYEAKIRAAWEAFKKNPTEANAHKFIQYLVNVSSDLWPAVLANVLGLAVDELTPDQTQFLKDELETHHNYLKTSLMPDVIKAIGAGTLDSLNYRTIFLYAGALWAFGSLATVMFDGLSLRDLADIFLFAGPDDTATCDGERGCHQHVGKFYTVAEIIANGIIPGRLRCLTNCRHILIPIASPLREKEFGSNGNGNGNGVGLKHLAGQHDQRRHAPISGTYTYINKWSVAFSDFAGFEKYIDKSLDKTVGGLYDLVGRKFYATTEGHQEIASALFPRSGRDRSRFLDSSVRFVGTKDSNGNLSLVFDAAFAAAGDDYAAGMSNIYKAFDALKLHGFPTDTAVTVRTRMSNGADVVTTLKHLPGEHDQRRHAPVTVARGSTNIPKGEYESHGSASDRWTAEKQMNKLAGVKDYKAANKAGWFTVKIGDQYHIINTKKKAGAKEPKAAPPKPKEPKATKPELGVGAKERIRPGVISPKLKVDYGDVSEKDRTRLNTALGKIPLEHQELVRSVSIQQSSYSNVSDDLRNTTAYARYADRSVHLSSRSLDLGKSTAHEVGHIVLSSLNLVKGKPYGMDALRKGVYNELQTLWDKRAEEAGIERIATGHTLPDYVAKRMQGVSAYAKGSPGEFAAETYAYYVTDPTVLAYRDMEAYTIVSKMFKGQEYIEPGYLPRQRQKHLPGMHNQLDHGRRTANVVEHFSDGKPGTYIGYRAATQENLREAKYTGAVFVAEWKDVADMYNTANRDLGSKVYKVAVDVKKPFVLRGNEEAIEKVTGTPAWALKLNGLVVVRPALRKYLLDAGYDAIITHGEGYYASRNYTKEGMVLIALNPANMQVLDEESTEKHLPGMHDQRSHGYRFGSQASSLSYLRKRRSDLTQEQWADYVQRARNKRDELLKKAPIRAKMLKDEQYTEEGKDKYGCEYRIYMTTRKWWRNDITADQFSPDDERNRIKATIDNVRSILKDDPDFVKAIDYDGELMVRQANRRVGVHAVFTRQQDDFGMGSGGPGGAKVFYGPYDEIHRNAGLQKYMGTLSLGVDPIFVTVHELHHAFHSSSEFDEFTDAVTLDTHLKLGNNLMPVNVNNQLGDYVRRANYRAQGKYKHITLTSRVVAGWLYRRHKAHIDALVDESWGDRAGEVKAKLEQWSKIKPKPWRDEEYGYAEKHLAGRHDQHSHAPAGKRLELDEYLRGHDVVQPSGDPDSPGYVVNPHSPTEFVGMFKERPTAVTLRDYEIASCFYDARTGSIVCGLEETGHTSLAKNIVAGEYNRGTAEAIKEYETRAVHFTLTVKQGAVTRVRFFVGRAGDPTVQGTRDETLAYKNIYRAMDRLSAWGLSDDTHVSISGLTQSQLVDTTLKHLPGQHDQRRHAPVSVRGSANIPAGEYDSHAVGATRWQAESQMNKLAGVKNYKDANAKGYFTVKVGDEYHVINTKANNGKQEPPQISRHELATSPEEAAAIVSKLSVYGGGGDPYHNRLLIDQLKATPALAHQAVAYVKALGNDPSSLSSLGLAVGDVIRSGSAEGALQYSMDYFKTAIAHYDEVLDGLKRIKKPDAKTRNQIKYGEELRQRDSEALARFETAMGRLLKETPMEPVQSTVRLRKPKLGTVIRTKGGRLNVSSTIDETTHAIAPYGANFGVKDVADAIAEQGLMVVDRSSMLEHDDRIGHNQIKAKLDEIANDYASQLIWLGVGKYHRMSKVEMEDADYRSKRSAEIAARKASRKKLKHLPGEHDQRRHAPGGISAAPGTVTVTRGSANIAKGEYHTYGSHESRWIAEKQMNDLAGVKDYKAANANGWFTVKIGNAYHIIYTKKNEPTTEPKQVMPKPKEPKPIVQGRMYGSFEFPSYLAGEITESEDMLTLVPGTVRSSIKIEGSTKNRERIIRTLKLLPRAHQRIVRKLVAVEGESFLGDDGKRLAGSASAEGQRIRIATDCDFGNSDAMPPYSPSLVHEVGHLVLGITFHANESYGYQKLRRDVRMRLEDIWKVRAGAAGLEELPTGNYQSFEKSKSMLAVSWYSKTNPSEFAAEAYSYYVTKPMVLWREDPVTYNVMKDMFGGHEYITEDQKTYAPDTQY